MIDPAEPVEAVARRLLGARLRTHVTGDTTEIVINEVEAYGGGDDPASHAFSGETARNRSMFQVAGTLYVYKIYGVHWCANVVTGPAGRGEAVLIRGGRPSLGREAMVRRRGRAEQLTDGPGKVCQALGITGQLDGVHLGANEAIELEVGSGSVGSIRATPRVGITRATDRLWRFVID